MLRRDRHALSLFDLRRASWAALLRVVVGDQTPDHAHTTAGRGVLLRLLIGHSVAELLTDDALVRTIVTASPRTIRVSHA